jgi:Zn-dependent protease
VAVARRASEGSTWALTLVRVAGVRIRVHISFLILVALVLVARDPEVTSAAEALGWLAAIFACVAIHELSHSIVAGRRGVTVEEILLLPIGGVSRMKRLPDKPSDELAIAAAGPLASIGLAVLAGALELASGGSLVPVDLLGGSLLHRLAWLNLVLGLFNLLPAFPLDGGRVLRALLERRMDLARATKQAATMGRRIAIALMVLGVFVDVWLVLIGAFVYLGATAESASTLVHLRLEGRRVGDVMLLEPVVLDGAQTVADVRLPLRRTAQRTFPVILDDQVAGVVGRTALEHASDDAVVVDLADRSPRVVHPDDPVEETALPELTGSPLGAVVVVDRGKVVGLLTLADVQHLIED